ncbi:hypothetical protein JCM1841_000671 [Sporobolomyces salmonicolor]
MTVSLQGQRAVGSIYLALDAWTSPNEVEVLGVLAFFQTKAGKGKLKDYVVLISFQILVHRHSGAYLAKVVPDLCDNYGIEENVLGIAMDNTSNMGKMREELEDYGLGMDKWVHCWAHVLNLLVTQEDPGQLKVQYKSKKENKLTAANFDLITDLLKVLEPFECMTSKFSELGGGQIEDVIPMIDNLVYHLEIYLSENETVPPLYNALMLVLDKLFLYYGKTGNCSYYATSICKYHVPLSL